ncbi:MAG: transcriptional regulator [Methylotenera sp.]|nr:transcriptional regulator [Methylotenera sp.]MDO9231967.1 transcriptional regulator [Methylotenera sp.]MDO9388480.1 transcriptional regulator [Methylotenera sp.]MDP2102381.1 transcriptional regulator [Methylotenera sp.]MDP2281021.1 transcriptional regulator [Methylotenera sp.]
MIKVKRIELIIEAIEQPRVISTLKKINVSDYTIYKHVGGYGDRGERNDSAFGEKFENIAFIIACPKDQLNIIIESLRPILKSYGGMCLVSDAQWIVH